MGKLVRNGIEYSGSGGGGGGSSVEITPSLVSGTKIADYEIDGIEGSLYAPTPQVIEANPAGTASSTLTKLGIDGDIYELAGGGSGDVEDVCVNGTSVLDSNKIAQITSYKEITQAQYDALPATKESDGILYCIKDAVSTGGGGIENDTLYTNSGTNLESTITLTNAYTDYDFLIFRTIRSADNQTYYIDKIFNTKDLSTNDYLQVLIWYSTNYYTYQITSSTTLSLTNSGTYCYLYKIYGVKVLSGGGDGSAIIYSTTEREVGVWTDNKPLYQKTIPFTANQQTYNLDLTSLSIDSLIYEDAFVYSNNGYVVHMPYFENSNYTVFTNYYKNSKSLIFYFGSGMYQYYPYGCVTIQYTKTTDTPGSGSYNTLGVPTHHYSTDEQVVGTWVDGNTLYEKTFNLAGQYTVPNSGWGNTGITYDDYFDIIVGAEAVCQDSSAYYYIPCSATRASGTGKLLVAGVTASQNRAIQYLTVRYTKPTS